MGRTAGVILVIVALASAMHVDWHFARPTHHRLSLGWSQHWLIAIPVFALVGWYVCRVWRRHLVSASMAIVGIAAFLAQVVEPLEEMLVDNAPVEWAFGAERLAAFATFTGVGIIVLAATVIWVSGTTARTRQDENDAV
jgi:hypothetical protein